LRGYQELLRAELLVDSLPSRWKAGVRNCLMGVNVAETRVGEASHTGLSRFTQRPRLVTSTTYEMGLPSTQVRVVAWA
jgi:hypothetical protein